MPETAQAVVSNWEALKQEEKQRDSLLDGVSRSMPALARSLDAAFGRGVAYQPSYAGSGPEGVFQELFPKMQHAYSGFGPVEDRLHAPNEYIVVDDYIRGIEATARLYTEYAPR